VSRGLPSPQPVERPEKTNKEARTAGFAPSLSLEAEDRVQRRIR
jgi:hypothetical protein